jgi:hypothetical protein
MTTTTAMTTTKANNASQSNANPSFHFGKVKPPDQPTIIDQDYRSATQFSTATSQAATELHQSFHAMSESTTTVAGSSITNATVLLSSYLPPEAVAKGAARSPNLTRFIIAKQSRIEIFHRFQWWRIEGTSNYIRR